MRGSRKLKSIGERFYISNSYKKILDFGSIGKFFALFFCQWESTGRNFRMGMVAVCRD
jgi:hypothetical protein